MARPALDAIVDAGLAGGILISPVSAWEVGLLSRPGATRRTALEFLPDPKTWFAGVMAGPGVRLAQLTPDIAIDAWHLPGDLHGDPGDRLVIATARQLGVPIVTRDRQILAYARKGAVQAIRC